jgi:integrase
MTIRTRNGLPRYCGLNKDRHGRKRVRFRKGGFSTYIAGIPWGEDFMRQYAAALDGVKAQASSIGAERTIAGSVGALVSAYLDCSEQTSSPFKQLAAETRRTRSNILENFRAEHGDKPLYTTDRHGERTMLLTRQHMQIIVDKKAATPFAQRNFLNTVRVLFEWAFRQGRIPANPALGVTRAKVKTEGYKTGSEGDIERIEARWAIGSRERLAFALILYTGQRRGDVVRMGPRHMHDGLLTIEQSKTGAQVIIPVHPKLKEIIEATPTIGMQTFLVTQRGEPWAATSFGNWFREICDHAGCQDVSAHSFRKSTARRLAEMGCSASQIAAILGHATLKEVERYTKAADRKRLAREGMAKLIEGGW